MTRRSSRSNGLLILALVLGTLTLAPVRAAGAGPELPAGTCSLDRNGVKTTYDRGYWLAGADGGVYSFGQAPFLGSMGGTRLNASVVAIEEDPELGYWLASADGGVFNFGEARFSGSAAGRALPAPVVAMARAGYSSMAYRLALADGSTIPFGFSAADPAKQSPDRLDPPVAGIGSPHIGGDRYWLTDRQGRVRSAGYGVIGSTSRQTLNAPIIGMAAHPRGAGYWLASADGGVFAFGEAPFLGSIGGQRLNSPVVAIEPTSSGRGYWLVAADGGVFAFGDAEYFGSMAGQRLNAPIIGMAACHGEGPDRLLDPH